MRRLARLLHIIQVVYFVVGLLDANGGPAVLNLAIGGFQPIGIPLSTQKRIVA